MMKELQRCQRLSIAALSAQLLSDSSLQPVKQLATNNVGVVLKRRYCSEEQP